MVLHDRAIPGSRANLDHLVISALGSGHLEPACHPLELFLRRGAAGKEMVYQLGMSGLDQDFGVLLIALRLGQFHEAHIEISAGERPQPADNAYLLPLVRRGVAHVPQTSVDGDLTSSLSVWQIPVMALTCQATKGTNGTTPGSPSKYVDVFQSQVFRCSLLLACD
ncbi:hypothetical protein [Streptomyces sp. NPDC054834]